MQEIAAESNKNRPNGSLFGQIANLTVHFICYKTYFLSINFEHHLSENCIGGILAHQYGSHLAT